MNKFHLASMGHVNSPPQITTGKWTQPVGLSLSVHVRDLTQCHKAEAALKCFSIEEY